MPDQEFPTDTASLSDADRALLEAVDAAADETPIGTAAAFERQRQFAPGVRTDEQGRDRDE